MLESISNLKIKFAEKILLDFSNDKDRKVSELANRLLNKFFNKNISEINSRKIIISCHSDTNFKFHNLKRLDNEIIMGTLDNYAGVYSVMNAFFSGKIDKQNVRLELTYGEEDDFQGAREILPEVNKNDLVIVVDVTGTKTEKDFIIEKCYNNKLFSALQNLLLNHKFDFDIYDTCRD